VAGKRLKQKEKMMAYRMFMEGFSVNDIAEKVGRHPHTIEGLADQRGWEEKRDALHTEVLDTLHKDMPAQILEEVGRVDDIIAKITAALNAQDLTKAKSDKLLHELREWTKMRHQLIGLGQPGVNINVEGDMVVSDDDLRNLAKQIAEEKERRAKSD